MHVSKKEIAAIFNRDETTVSTWMKEKPPIPSWKDGSRRMFDTSKVIAWFVEKSLLKEEEARKSGKKGNSAAEKSLSVRREETELRLSEVKLLKLEGELVPIETYKGDLYAQCSRLRAVLKTIPSKYIGPVQSAATVPEALAVLETIESETVAALLATEEEALDEEAA